MMNKCQDGKELRLIKQLAIQPVTHYLCSPKEKEQNPYRLRDSRFNSRVEPR